LSPVNGGGTEQPSNAQPSNAQQAGGNRHGEIRSLERINIATLTGGGSVAQSVFFMVKHSRPKSLESRGSLELNAADPDAGLTGAGLIETPPLVVVYDGLQDCPYVSGRVARMPLEYPRTPLSPVDLDRLLELGYRRTGPMVYQTHCPTCQSCIPTRVDVDAFRLTRSMRRILNRGDRELELDWGKPVVDPERVRLFNEHRLQRGLSRNGTVEASDYHEFLVATCVRSMELSFRCQGRLIGSAIMDLGCEAINAVYTHFDPDYGRFSIGTLAVLKQIQLARETGRRFVYLGLYVASNPHLNYKHRFRPQQRLLEGEWRTISDQE
jgi:arginine-tRNA-protein transferase